MSKQDEARTKEIEAIQADIQKTLKRLDESMKKTTKEAGAETA